MANPNEQRDKLIRCAARSLLEAGLFVTTENVHEARGRAEKEVKDALDPTALQLMEETLSIVGDALERYGAVLSVGISGAEEAMVRELRSVARYVATVHHWEDVSDKARRIRLAIRQIDPGGVVWEEIQTHLKAQDTSSPVLLGNYIPI